MEPWPSDSYPGRCFLVKVVTVNFMKLLFRCFTREAEFSLITVQFKIESEATLGK